MNLFWAGFSYLEPLCATVATAATAPSSVAHQDKRAKLVHISPFSLIDKSLQIKLRREVSFFCKIHFQIFKLPFLNKTSNLILWTKNEFQLGKTVPTTYVLTFRIFIAFLSAIFSISQLFFIAIFIYLLYWVGLILSWKLSHRAEKYIGSNVEQLKPLF